MILSVTNTPGFITAKLNAFNSSYHSDYFAVRSLAKIYLATAPSYATALSLASALSRSLSRWGAGSRGAPSCKRVRDIASALNCTTLHRNLAKLEANITYLAITGNRRTLNPGSPFASVADFDNCMISTLHEFSSGVLVGNTNVTYPMKSLLLLTGFMPAFDSQVKGGLAIAGFVGVNKTQYMMPAIGSSDALKICSLPFYIADCVSRSIFVISREVAASDYPELAGEYGRIFDVLFFMQKRLNSTTAVVTYSPPVGIPWYAI